MIYCKRALTIARLRPRTWGCQGICGQLGSTLILIVDIQGTHKVSAVFGLCAPFWIDYVRIMCADYVRIMCADYVRTCCADYVRDYVRDFRSCHILPIQPIL